MRGIKFLEIEYSELERALDGYGRTILIDGKDWKEIHNVQFQLLRGMHYIGYRRHKFSVYIERQYFLTKARVAARMIRKDYGCRRACFPYIRNWWKFFCHCIAMVHFYVRGDLLNMNVYVRSWEYNKFFKYDIDTLLLARQIAAKKLGISEGYINIQVMSLHKEK